MAAYVDNLSFVIDVIHEAEAQIKNLGLPLGMSYKEVRDWMQKEADGDWTSAQVREENITRLADKAKKAWEKRGYTRPKPEERASGTVGGDQSLFQVLSGHQTNQCVTHLPLDPHLAHISPEFRRNLDIAEAVKAARKRYWQAEAPPFDVTALGEEEASKRAWAWVEEQVDKDIEALRGKAYHRFELRLRFEAADFLEGLVLAEDNVLSKLGWLVPLDEGRSTPPEHLHTPETRQAIDIFSAWLNENASNLKFLSVSLNLEGENLTAKMQVPTEIKVNKKTRTAFVKEWSYASRLPLYGVTPRLWRDAIELAKLCRFWKPDTALKYIMTGIAPRPTALWTLDDRWPGVLKIEVAGPVTEQEIVQLYRNICTAWYIRPPKITSTDLALLELKARYPSPDYTWGQRLEVWERWRRRHSVLRDFNKGSPSNRQQAITTAWRRAVDKARWQKKKRPSGTVEFGANI